ncbi:hypothetical protein ASG70_16795 [Phycicoccus sp. Soil748]|nr:hypothetical protein ASG70_16795 [Phycicoccus sp. Soil748]
MFNTWRDGWRNSPEPPLWRAILFAVGVILVLTWPLLRGNPINAVPAVLASLAGLALLLDLTRLGWSRLRRR